MVEVNRKRSSAEASLTEVSPVKPVAETRVDTGATARLEWKEPGVISLEKGGGPKLKLDFEENSTEKSYVPRAGTPPPPPSAREQKRPKKHTTPKKAKPLADTAASGTEGRLAL